MTFPPEPTIDEITRSRACKLLGVAPDAAPDECRRAVLERLEHADFQPPAAWRDSIEVLFGPERSADSSGNLRPALRDEVENGLRDEVDEFVSRFFAMPPAERTQIWIGLCRRAKSSPVHHRRLAGLAPGLELADQELSTSPRDRLIHWIREMFVLPPQDRVAIWVLASDAMADSTEEWLIVAEDLLRLQPELARLVPELVNEPRAFKARQIILRSQAARRQQEACKAEQGLTAYPAGTRESYFRLLYRRLSGAQNGRQPQIADSTRDRRRDGESRQASAVSFWNFRVERPWRWIAIMLTIEFFAVLIGNDFLGNSIGTVGRPPRPLQMQNSVPIVRGLFREVRNAVETLPAEVQSEIQQRIFEGRKLTAPQAEVLEGRLEALHRDEALRMFREFQKRARPDPELQPAGKLSGDESVSAEVEIDSVRPVEGEAPRHPGAREHE